MQGEVTISSIFQVLVVSLESWVGVDRAAHDFSELNS